MWVLTGALLVNRPLNLFTKVTFYKTQWNQLAGLHTIQLPNLLFIPDEPGCVNHDCADANRCVDVRAPGTGYRCVS